MKRHISCILIVALLSSMLSLFGITASAAFPNPSIMNGYENLCLTYTWNPDRVDNGQHNEADLMPYVAYHDKNGNIQDFFFDSFLFLPCVKRGVTGGSLHYWSSTPNKALDWTSYIEDTFAEGANINALETAFGKAKQALNAPNKKAGVFLTILYPGTASGSSFGSLGGRTINMTKMEDRKYAVKWMIDEQLRLYTEAGYENLDLIGFYWLEEWIVRSDDSELLNYTADYLDSLGLKFLWIPYYDEYRYANWQSYGFDIACRQPNMYWDTSLTKTRVENCINSCINAGMAVEIETDYRSLSSTIYYNRYLDYLEACMQGGAMDSIKMYYQDGKNAVFYNAYVSSSKRTHAIYDLTYKYAKGTLTQEDIDNNRAKDFTLPEDVDWISIGKKYTATAPYYATGSAEYLDNDGTELTDGVLGFSDLGTDWHAYHVSNRDADGRMSVTIDLGEVRDDLTNFMIQFSHAENYGIGDPKDDIKVYISEDGTDFELIAQPSLKNHDYICYVSHETAPVTARYVKYSFTNSDANFVFCGEALVGVSDNPIVDDFANKTNVAFGKYYEGADPTPVNPTYSANLTDGKASMEGAFNSEWFGFYYSKAATADKINAPNGIGTVIIDLGRAVTEITDVRVHVWNCNNSGVSAAKSIKLLVSNDGNNYTSVGELEIPESDSPDWAVISTDNITARYVKLVFETQDIWTFLNEIQVYSTSEITFEPGVGDVDNDGDVDSLDYLFVKRYCLGTYDFIDSVFVSADVNKNGIVDTVDYLLVKRIVLGTYSA